ncbi:MAG: F0F1 ATP synthase subunit gamma [Actinomycetota bacterium]|nr:F0F1 ATP synthase subunit gamma [Actinomycetota bacterium]
MASGQERQLRRRIKSVQSTKKITRAMEMIAASRIVKAQQRVAAARPYSEQITEVLRQLAAAGVGLDHPLLKERHVQTVGYVVLAADRGLAGGYNSSVLRTADRALQADRKDGKDYSLSLSGRKAEGYFRYRGYKIDEAHTGFTEQPTYEDARKVAGGMIERYSDGDVDQVQVVYTRFFSAGSQRVVNVRLLPLEKEAIEDLGAEGPKADYEFEPSAEGILELLLPRYVESRVFAALLDASASEQAARQRAMKSATDNAEDMVKTLGIQANKIRQAGITTEIMEVVGGAESLRQ